jgi:dephospho-CoA kinase
MRGQLLILVTGMPGSGKTTLSDFIKKMGYSTLTMGEIVRNLARTKGPEYSSKSLGELATEMRRLKGKAVVAEESIKLLKNLQTRIISVDGIRGLDEVEIFKKEYKVKLVAVHARPRIRYERLKKRDRPDDPEEWNDFVWRDRRELEFGLGSVIALADFMLVNEGSIQNLRKNWEEIMEDLI